MVILILNHILERSRTMPFFLIVCAIIIVITLVIMVILLSTIKLKIKDFELANKKHIKPNYEVIFSFYFLNKIKWLSIRFNDKKMRKIATKIHLERIDIKKLEKDLTWSDIQAIIRIRPKISQLNLRIKVGVEDVLITSYLISILCSIFSILLPRVTEKKNIKNIKYKIEPVYNQNSYHIKLNTTVEMKIINIWNSIHKIYKSRKNMYKVNQFGTYYQYKSRIKES